MRYRTVSGLAEITDIFHINNKAAVRLEKTL